MMHSSCVVLLLLVVGCVVQADECCSVEDRKEVLALWNSIWSAGYSGRRVTVASAVFADLFERAPEAKRLFTRVLVDDPDSPEFEAHCVRVINGLDTLLNLLHEPVVLQEQLSHLTAQHAARDGVKADYFELMGESFDNVLSQVIPCFNADAWNRCYSSIAAGISAGL